MRKGTFIIFFLFLVGSVFAQYKNNKWILGAHGVHQPPNDMFGGMRIEFNPNRVLNIDTLKITLTRCFSGLSDKNDQWFLYTNGTAICNKDHDTIVNGDALSPGADPPDVLGMSQPAQAIFLPKDTVNEKHYLFHQNTLGYLPGNPVNPNKPVSRHVYYSIVDPFAGNGRGEVISKNNLVVDDTLEVSNLLAVRHANGRDWWVLFKRFNVNAFYSVLATPDSVYPPTLFYTDCPPYYTGGQACFSPDGRYYASFTSTPSQLKIYDFDRCSGLLSNCRGKFIQDSLPAAGLSFSPNSRYLYISSVFCLWQFDMEATDVLASQTLIATWDGFIDTVTLDPTGFWHHWLAPDGKIYFTTGGQTRFLHVLNQPDLPGAASDYQAHSIQLPFLNNRTIPTSINLSLYHLPGSPCDTLGVGLREQKRELGSIKLMPNPNEGSFAIEYEPQSIHGMLYVYDVSGRRLYSEYVSPYSSIKHLNLSTKLSPGVYALSLVFADKIRTEKFVVRSE